MKKQKIQYGRSYRYGSNEAAVKDLTRLEKKQREAKEKRMADEKVTCAHCGVETDDGQRICVDCFIIGHRGVKCDEYCKPDKHAMFALEVLRRRARPSVGES